MSRRKRRHLKSPRSLTVSSVSRSHSGCLLHQGILLTPIPFVPWQSGLPFPRYNLTLKIQGQSQGQRYPSQCSVQLIYFLSVSHQGILLTPVPSFHDNRAAHSRDTIWPKKIKNVKSQGKRYASQHSIQLTHFLFVSHQVDQPFLRYGKYNVQLQKTDLKS